MTATLVDGGLLDVPGFQAQGVHAGLKYKSKDLTLIVSDRPATAAAVFTQNSFAAAPIQVSREHLAQGPIQAIVCNSANANACTGPQGLEDAYTMAQVTGKALGLPADQVLVSSTGIIGRPLDMATVVAGIEACAGQLDQATGGEAAEAITTTDTHAKEVLAEVDVDGRTFKIGAIAKGSGMIHPNMATMLAFLATDAPVDQATLQATLKDVVDETFNMITVDGDESTNDMVAILAGGAEGGPTIQTGTPEHAALAEGLHLVCRELARMIAGDGEGATSLVEVVVDGAETQQDARIAARAIAASNLVKAAIHGRDPNWGRIVAAIGASPARVEPDRVTIAFEDSQTRACVLDLGHPATNGALKEAERVLENDEVRIHVELGLGPYGAEAWGCDLTEAYVTFNAAYTS